MFYFIDAWLITAGTNAGVVKEVGEAINTYRYKHQKHGLDIPCIGICSWNLTAGCEQLTVSTQRSKMHRLNVSNNTAKALKIPLRPRSSTSDLVRMSLF